MANIDLVIVTCAILGFWLSQAPTPKPIADLDKPLWRDNRETQDPKSESFMSSEVKTKKLWPSKNGDGYPIFLPKKKKNRDISKN